MASNVPKFASFRPKPKAAPEQEPPREHRKTSDVPDRPKHKTRDRRSPSPPPKKLKLDKDTSSSKLFFSDRRGDADILRYGVLNRYDVPSYRRYGYGCVLGLDPNLKIDRERSSDTKLYITPARRPRQERLLTDKRIAKEGSRALRFIRPSSQQTLEADEDFIAVGSHKKESDDTDEEETLETSYRSIEGKPKADEPVDPDTQYDSNTETVDNKSEDTQKNFMLVRKTREKPEDLQTWLDFINHQEVMMSLERPLDEMNDATRQQLADVRIPIYEEALKKVRSDPDKHLVLYKDLLKEAQKSWNEARLSSKFEEVLLRFPTSTDLWFTYLNFVQSSFTKFKYESCLAAFSRCFAALRPQANDSPESILHVLIRMTSMIHGTGYQELALAIWQAVLETHLSPPRSEGFHSFEDFWESEAPRIGEEGAQGWKSASLNSVPPSGARPLHSKAPSDAVFEDFSKREADAIDQLRYPGRTSDDVGEDDAFHTIFYADIQEYIKFVPPNAPTTLVLEAFLCFCGLPPLSRTAAHQREWWNDPFLSNVTPSRAPLGHTEGETRSDQDFEQKVRRFAACPSQSYQMTSELLFENEFPFGFIRLSADFERRVLKQVVASDATSDDVGEYLLAFEVYHFPSEVVKSAKQLLKSRPSSQRLYLAYGLVELRRGNSSKAAQVFSMAMSLGSASTTSLETLTLHSCWVWEALDRGDQIEALWRLVSRSGKLPARSDSTTLPGQSTLDATRSAIGDACEQALLRHDDEPAVICTALLALITYLSDPTNNAEAALAAHQNLTNYFSSHKLSTSQYAELHAQSIARLLRHHVTHASILRPALLRSALEPHIALFPNNTILLSLYAANETRFAIDDRVRGIMQHSALQRSHARSVAGWSFAIHFETLRGEVAGSTSHSMRALYKRATHVESCGAHSPALWAAYVRFEGAQLGLLREKIAGKKAGKDGKKRGWESRLEEAEARVRETFFLGMRCVPWCKEFVILAFVEGGVGGVLGEEEKWMVYRVLGEKEMRVYVELE